MKISKDVYLVGDGMMGLSNQYDCHVYVIHSGSDTMLIDAGSGLETEYILKNIQEDGFDPRNIPRLFVTHSHVDHAGGVKRVRDEIGCEIIAPAPEARYMVESTEFDLGLDVTKATGYFPKDYVYEHFKPDTIVNDGDKIKVGHYELKCITVPGHNFGPTGLLLTGEGRQAFFSNDIVFINGTIGLGNWPGSSLADYRKHIGKLGGLGVEELYPGHFLWVLRGGQQHLDKAIANLKLAFPPPNFSHNYPHW